MSDGPSDCARTLKAGGGSLSVTEVAELLQRAKPDLGTDPVSHPSHYTAYPVEVIDIIRATLGPEGFKAYCFGSEIKYRMRAGLKGEGKAQEDLAKAMMYKTFREGGGV